MITISGEAIDFDTILLSTVMALRAIPPKDYMSGLTIQVESFSPRDSGSHQLEEICRVFDIPYDEDDPFLWDEVDFAASDRSAVINEHLRPLIPNDVPYGTWWIGHLESDGSYGLQYTVD